MQTHTHEVSMGTTEVRKRFRSWDRGEPDREWACLQVLAREAPGLAPRPLRREISDGAPVVVMERLPGMPLGAAPLTGAQTSSLGRALRRLYAIPLEHARSAGICERTYGPTTLVSTLTEWLADDYDLSQCQRPDHVESTITHARTWLASNPLPVPDITVLGIADLNPANIIWDGHHCRLIDFEDAGLSDPAYELADHVEHIASRLLEIFDVDGLIESVGLTDSERGRMVDYRRLWATFWLAMLLPGNGGFHRNPAGTTELQSDHLMRLLHE